MIKQFIINDMARVKLTYGTASVSVNVTKETIQALNKLAELIQEQEGEQCDIHNVSTQYCECETPSYNYPEMLWCDKCFYKIKEE